MYQNLGFESGSGRETAAVREQMCCVVIDPTGQRVLRLVVAHPTSPTVYTGCMASEKGPRPLCYTE